MKQYKDLITLVLTGDRVQDRTGVGTRRVFGTRMEFDLSEGFPAVTEKALAWNAVRAELLWFIRGSTNVNELRYLTHGSTTSVKKTIWDDNYNNQAKALGYINGNLGPVYGRQWRSFNGVDQMKNLIEGLVKDPYSRRHIVTAWNPSQIDQMALPPCHYTFQCFVSKDGKLSLMWHQRSVDVFLGLPFNIASYALLTHIIADCVGLKPGKLIFTGGDTHIYNDHLEQCGQILRNESYPLPTLKLPESVGSTPWQKFQNFCHCVDPKDIQLENYKSHGKIAAKMAV